MTKLRVLTGAFIALGALWIGSVATADAKKSDGRAKKVSAKEARIIELGRRLFFDPLVSQTATTSCASCHDPDHGFSDPERFSLDERGATPRHSQVILDTGSNPSAHWDGEFGSIGELVTTRMTRVQVYYGSPTTPGLPTRPAPTTPTRGRLGRARAPASAPSVTASGPNGQPIAPGAGGVLPTMPTSVTLRIPPTTRRGRVTNNVPLAVQESGRYDEAFKAAFGSPSITLEKLAKAMESYCHSIVHTEAAFDRYNAGDESALTAAQKRGHELFHGKAGCAQCHTTKGDDPLLTDFGMHNTGVSYLEHNELTGTGSDTGRLRITTKASDLRRFKTPTLRDVTRRGPYMHDGRFETLERVVRFYASGCGTDPHRSKKVKDGFSVTDQEVRDLVDFLGALEGDERPGLAKSVWRARAKKTKLRFLNAHGKPIEGLDVTLRPFGDVIPVEGDRAVGTREVTTDRSGWVEFDPCATTHTQIQLPAGLEPEHGSLIPDTCSKTFLKLPVEGRTRIVLVMPLDVKAPKVLYVADRRSPATTIRRGGVTLNIETVGGRVGTPYFKQVGVVEAGDQRIARYEGWLRSDIKNPVELKLPTTKTGETEVRSLELAVDEELRIYVASPERR